MASQTQTTAPDAPPLPPNFFDAKPMSNYRSFIFAVCIPLVSFCWMTTGIRLYSRFRITKSPGWDDFFVVLTLLTVTLGTVAFCVSTIYGMGQHIYLIDPANITKFLLCHYIMACSYTSSTPLIKISLLFQYLRVFERGTIVYRLTQIVLVFVALWGIIFAFTTWFGCLPDPSAFWKMTNKGCYWSFSTNSDVVMQAIVSQAGFNVASDFIVLGLAFQLLFEKDAPKNKKGMAVLLVMGSVTCGFAVWRLLNITKSRLGATKDPTWDEPGPAILSLVEIYIASLCACTPFFWPVISEQLNKIFVTYEFKVSSESRHRDDEIELAHTESWPEGTKSGSVKEDVRSLGGESRGMNASNKAYYGDDYIQNQVNPFAEEYRSEAVVRGGKTGRKGSQV